VNEWVRIATEGTTDAAVARRLLRDAGLQPGVEYVKNGKGALDQSLRGFNIAARRSCWLVLRDLDEDAGCAPELRVRLLPSPEAHMRFHVPVHAVEAWLLADVEAMSAFLSISEKRVPRRPEDVARPKLAVVELARRSRKRSVRDAIVPEAGTTAQVGPGYVALMTEFAVTHWRPSVAERRSQSLARLRSFLRAKADRTSERG
jgi:hypothetical protein